MILKNHNLDLESVNWNTPPTLATISIQKDYLQSDKA